MVKGSYLEEKKVKGSYIEREEKGRVVTIEEWEGKG